MLDCRVCLAPLSQGPRWHHDDANVFPHSVDLSCFKRWLLACKQAGREPTCPICFSAVHVIHEEKDGETITTRISELVASVIQRRRHKTVFISLARKRNDFVAMEELLTNLSPPTGFDKTDQRMSRELVKVLRKLLLEGHGEIANLVARTGSLAPEDALKVMEISIVQLKNEELADLLWNSFNGFIEPDRVLMDAIHNDFWALAQRIVREKPIKMMSKWETLVFAAARNRREIIDLLLVEGTFSVPRWVWVLAEERAHLNGFHDLAKFLQTKRDPFVPPS